MAMPMCAWHEDGVLEYGLFTEHISFRYIRRLIEAVYFGSKYECKRSIVSSVLTYHFDTPYSILHTLLTMMIVRTGLHPPSFLFP